MTKEELDALAGENKRISVALLMRKLKLNLLEARKKLDECEKATYKWPELGIDIIR